MSISCIQNVGQFGNQLFPTTLANLAAHKHNIYVPMYQNKLLKFRKCKVEKPDESITEEVCTANPMSDKHKNKNIKIKRGYYQDGSYFNPYRNIIKREIFDLPEIKKNTKDIVLHLRMDGFNHEGHNSHVIHPDWYIGILEKEEFEKVYIVMATKSGRVWKKQEPHKKRYIDRFSKYNYEIISNDEYTDFNFIRSFDKIISSNSTFSWWASFCSEASKIYMPQYFEGKKSNLTKIGDESIVVKENYKYINVENMETVGITFN
jgi:hypothetical protein